MGWETRGAIVSTTSIKGSPTRQTRGLSSRFIFVNTRKIL